MEGPRKKLTDAARYWAGADREDPEALQVDDAVVQAMRAWNAPPEEIAKVQAVAAAARDQADARPFALWRENALSFHHFHEVRTQWVYAGMEGRRMGLNYAGVHAHLETHAPRRKRRSLMADVQLMEKAVLQADAELRQKKENTS